METKIGKIVRLTERGFGFIAVPDDRVEYFFHTSGLERTTRRFNDLREGDEVRFTAIAGPKGPRAIEVRVL